MKPLVPMNRKSLIDNSLQEVADALGVELIREYMPHGHDFELKIRLAQIPSPHGFTIRIYDDYLTWKVELNLDVFTAPLIESMQAKFVERREGIEPYLELAKTKNNFFHFSVNGSGDFVPKDQDWREIDFVLAKSYYSEESEFETLSAVILDFMCIVLFLLIEDIEWTESDELGREEGGQTSELVNKFERSRYNRALCLKYYGFMCRGCGDLLEKRYGPIGANVIHVHHIVPVSQMGSSYKLNPIKDLVPLCPNCHNIVHKTNPPMRVQDLNKLANFTRENV